MESLGNVQSVLAETEKKTGLVNTHTSCCTHTHTLRYTHIYYTHSTGVKTLETVGISILLRHGLVSLR